MPPPVTMPPVQSANHLRFRVFLDFWNVQLTLNEYESQVTGQPDSRFLIDWLKLLMAEDIPPEALHSTDRKIAIPPLHGALLKNEQDVHLFERLVFMAAQGR